MRVTLLFQLSFLLVFWLGLVEATQGQLYQDVPSRAQGIIFAADGSGGSEELTTPLWHEIVFTKAPYLLERVHWSRFSWYPEDHADIPGQMLAAKKLAGKAHAFRQAHPDKKIIFMGYSSGCHVVLAAAGMMPPNSIDRVFVLAPSVSHDFPLGGTLRASKEGLDVFYSHEDVLLSSAVGAFGTADGKRGPVAGCVGFWLRTPQSPEAALYRLKLRQYPWSPAVQWTGHRGNHDGWLERKFLRAYVMPKLR